MCARWATIALILVASKGVHAQQTFQARLDKIMKGMSGAVIVSNPRTGVILAIWNHEVAFQNAFPPGSTAKIVASAMALENNLVRATEKINCRRIPVVLGEAYRCSHPEAVEAFTLSAALANSCNYYFSALSTRLDASTLERGYAMFGLGSGHGTNGLRSAIRISSGPAPKARATLGESPVLVTPEELLLAYSAVATGGTVYRLRKEKKESSKIVRTLRLRDSTWEVLTQGLEECVRSGTCQAAAVRGVHVAGKTGTSGFSDGSGITHAWFVGYAGLDVPEVAIVVFLAHGTGGRDAAPLAGRILREYFASRGSP